jgi:hypothetical protein
MNEDERNGEVGGHIYNRNVILISFSAFFADMGYQLVIAGLPYFLVFVLGAPVIIFGFAEALNYGVGSVFAYFGGKMADRYGYKKISVLGNAFIPILSFTGFAIVPLEAVGTFATGWWMRNLRSPARRTLFAKSVSDANRSRSFGLLHGLDVGGGIVATILLMVMLFYHYEFRFIFLVTIVPLVISTILVAMTRDRKRSAETDRKVDAGKRKFAFGAVLLATALFGFSFYSMGFPILTVSEYTSSPILGVGTYTIFLAVSSFTGFSLSRFTIRNEMRALGFLGYILAGLGSLGFVISIIYSIGITGFYVSSAVIAVAVGFIETFEPTIITVLSASASLGGGMGKLSSARSIGLFTGNLLMGVFYTFGAQYSYIYAVIVSVIAGGIILFAGRGYMSFKKPQAA